MKPVPARVNFLLESGGAPADHHASHVSFFHFPRRMKHSCATFSSSRSLLAALQKSKQFSIDLIFESGAHAVRPARNNFQRGAFDQLGSEKRRVRDGHDLVVVSMKNE